MESYFLLFYAVHFLLLTAENLAVFLAHFVEGRGGKLGNWGEMMERVAIISWTVLTLGT